MCYGSFQAGPREVLPVLKCEKTRSRIARRTKGRYPGEWAQIETLQKWFESFRVSVFFEEANTHRYVLAPRFPRSDLGQRIEEVNRVDCLELSASDDIHPWSRWGYEEWHGRQTSLQAAPMPPVLGSGPQNRR
eukprot:1061862-Pelagomonas_calceolata.AAC.1